jgi:hypothetical protein
MPENLSAASTAKSLDTVHEILGHFQPLGRSQAEHPEDQGIVVLAGTRRPGLGRCGGGIVLQATTTKRRQFDRFAHMPSIPLPARNCRRPCRGLKTGVLPIPGVPLRFTSGYTPEPLRGRIARGGVS